MRTTRNRPFFLMLIVLFISIILIMPSAVFAQEANGSEEQEPEELVIDVRFDEVNAYGITGERFEFKIE